MRVVWSRCMKRRDNCHGLQVDARGYQHQACGDGMAVLSGYERRTS